jgi:hypothetical protein
MRMAISILCFALDCKNDFRQDANQKWPALEAIVTAGRYLCTGLFLYIDSIIKKLLKNFLHAAKGGRISCT